MVFTSQEGVKKIYKIHKFKKIPTIGNKYNAKKVKNEIGSYDSQLEANYRKFILEPKLKEEMES